MNYAFNVQTHPGLLRQNNEDAAAFDAECGLGVLADGMGGYNAGEVASSMAVSVIRAELGDWLTAAGAHASLRDTRKALERSVHHANEAILNAARNDAHFAGMGTTLVVAAFQPHHVVVGHIGDSRAYRMRQRQLTRLTRDHSLLQEQLDAGLITPSQAASSSQRNLVTRALGIDEDVQVEINEFSIALDDLYLLCSDGLSDMLDDSQIASILASDKALDHKGRELIVAANAQGGRDNITVLLAQTLATPPRQSLMARLLRA